MREKNIRTRFGSVKLRKQRARNEKLITRFNKIIQINSLAAASDVTNKVAKY